MKLIKTGVNDFLWETLCKFSNEKMFENYYLAGGTALSLQIGHRISTDIDLFTQEILNKEEILYFARSIYKNVEIINSSGMIFQILFTDNNEKKQLKVDFVNYDYPLIEPLVTNDDNIRLAGKNDISAMKMSAAGTRGYEARDFIDLYFLLKEINMEKIVENFKKKYNTENIQHYLRSINYFNDVSEESWKSIKYISEEVLEEEIKKTLNNEVNKYWNDYINRKE